MKTKYSKPLVLAFIIVCIIFLLFCGGAITMTIKNSGMNNNGMLSNMSWLWAPAMLALLLSVLLGWTIFRKNND